MKDKLRVAFYVILIGFCIWVAGPLLYSYWRYSPQDGDIIFQSLPKYSDLVTAIEGDHSPLSHCGIVIKKEDGWYVREAIGDVHDTKLFAWIKRGRDYKFEAFRLKDNYKKYIPKFITESSKYLGKPYDVHYSFDDEYIYCSELVYKAFKNASGIQLGLLCHAGELGLETI